MYFIQKFSSFRIPTKRCSYQGILNLCFLFMLVFLGNVHSFAQSKEKDLACYNFISSSFEKQKKLIRWGLNYIFPDKISVEMQDSAGREMVEYYESGELLLDDKVKQNRLDRILDKLVRQLPDPLGFNYEIFISDEKYVNAWTLGGKILITDSLLSFCRNDDELACIISHEIMHNELGHIELEMRDGDLIKMLFSSYSGKAEYILSFFRDPFLQEDEAYSDMYGIDLADAAGFNICSFKDFWERMDEEDGEDDDFFSRISSTHPSSKSRSICIANYISKNYKKGCIR